jgi:hypothetical protein
MVRLFQFSIRSLLVAVTIAAVGIAALLNANGWWETGMWSLALLTLASGVLLIIYRRDEVRAFWIGYVVFGGLFVAVLIGSVLIEVYDSSLLTSRPLYYLLPTTKLTQVVYDKALPESRRQEQIPGPAQTTDLSLRIAGRLENAGAVTTGYATSPQRVDLTVEPTVIDTTARVWMPLPTAVLNPKYVPPSTFISIAHALWLLLIAAAGGKVCQLIYRTRPQTEK